MECIACSG